MEMNPMIMLITKRKGMMHSIEAMIAFFIVMSFLLFILPLTPTANTSASEINYVSNALKTLEEDGTLSDYIYTGNLSGLNTTLHLMLPETYRFEVSISEVNVTYGSFSANNSITTTIDRLLLDFAILDIVYGTATDPKIYLNGNIISSTTGTVSGTIESIDLTDDLVDGTNTLKFNFTDATQYDYHLLVSEFSDVYTLPQKTDINTINYFFMGANKTFRPSNVRVYLWD